MEKNKYKLGDLTEEYNEINADGELNDVSYLQGINNAKYFQESNSNKNDIDLLRYKICRNNTFAYNKATSRNGEKISIAYRTDGDCLVSPSYICFKVIRKDLVLDDYLMLWFRRPVFDRYVRFNSWGSATEFFTYSDFAETEIELPSIEEQEKIVKMYNIISNRIRIKEKINNNLQSQAQTYFNLIFADKDTEKPLPQGWKVAKVGDYCIDNVANLSKADDFESILYLDTGSITSNYIVELQELNLLTDEIPSRAKRKATDGDIVYSTVRPNLRHYGLLQNPPENLIVSTGFAVLHNKGLEVANEFLFMWLTNESILDYLQAIAENSVSTYPSLNVSDIMNVKVIVPDADTLERITRFLSSIFTAISQNNRQIQMLTKSLDTLLPKLLSRR